MEMPRSLGFPRAVGATVSGTWWARGKVIGIKSETYPTLYTLQAALQQHQRRRQELWEGRIVACLFKKMLPWEVRPPVVGWTSGHLSLHLLQCSRDKVKNRPVVWFYKSWCISLTSIWLSHVLCQICCLSSLGFLLLQRDTVAMATLHKENI